MCSSPGAMFNLILVTFVYLAVSVDSQDDTTTIPLNTTITYINREMYGGFRTLIGVSTIKVNFTDVHENLTHIVFQVHSHLYNVTLYQNAKLPNSQVVGTNVGLVSFTQPKLDTFYIVNSNPNVTIRVYISVHGYIKTDTIPGGCNMEFPVQISPYIRTMTNSEFITVDFAAASIDPKCEHVNLAVMEFYMMYLPEMNFYADVYFDGIRKMMTLENIKNYGHEIPRSSWPPTRRMLSTYPGTGAVYAVVAWPAFSNGTPGYSVYVPSYSYGCSIMGEEEGCDLIDDMLSQMLCAVLLFVGGFMCFFGHRFFKTEMFLAGLFSGGIISYILIAVITVIDKSALLAAATLSGVFFGALWLLFWWLYGIPVIAILLPSLNLGFLLAAIFYYRLPDNLVVLETDFNFWIPFTLVMLLTALALVSVTYAASILCCAILGAYATVLSVDYYLGSNLKFIIVNTIRRASVPEFNKVSLYPPFQWRDFSMTLTWVVLAILGFLFQHWHNRGRPPFPPPSNSVRPSMPEPILYGSIIGYRTRSGRDTSTPVPPTSTDERTPLLA